MSELCTLKIISPSSSIQTCFFYFNENGIQARLKNFTTNNFTLKIYYGENYSQYIYGSFAPQSRNELADGCIGLCSKFANCLNLNEGAQLLVSSCDVNEAKAVYVSPMLKDDFTILDEEKGAIERIILNQVRVISRYQCVPIQVYANVSIKLHVEKLEPDIEYGLLVEDTELRIMPYQERKKEVPVKPLGNSSNPVANFIKQVTDKFSSNFENDNNDETLQRKLAQIKTEYRIVSSTELENDIPFNIRNKYVIIHHFPKKNFYGPCYLKLKCRIENVNEFVFNSYVICLNDSSDNLLYCPIYLLRKHKIPLGAKVHLEEVKNVKCEKELKIDLRRDPTWAQNIKDNIIETINDNIKYRQNINSLIIGNAGTGKTYLINSVSNELSTNMIFCGQIDCRPLRGKKIETLLKLLNEKLSECSRNQPSALIIDDLDALTYLSEENEQQFNLLYSSRIGEMLTSCIRSYQRHSISVIATASKLSQLGSLATIRGPRLFENVEEISEMQMQDRLIALKNIASSKNLVLNQKLLNHVVEKTNGYNIQDLVDLVEKAVFLSLMRTSKTSEINQEDFDDALKETIPLSLRGVELHKNIPNKWENIGGMNEAKKILIEVFAWPSKYPELFKSCPLRHQSGVLLYGAPGTGKTLIAGAVANECGMNFISIKGPELLSKYVGASEEGVRNLFIRAQKAQPCVLFFDEFDSLAPRRGHDSTGVTDRVVNQLLTQLDGVEALNGVWVLAATSRPDLLDPALLRPGRLDRTVYCALPDKDDRVSILKALAKKLRLADDVDFEEVAEKSEGYTGADLQGVLYSAQMIPIKKLKNQNLDNISGKSLIVTQDDLLKALEETKPSMTEKEKEKYHRIYERFISSRGADFADQTGKQKKITFA